MKASLTSRFWSWLPEAALGQQRSGVLSALSLRQYSAAASLFQRMRKVIEQLPASRSMTQSSGFTIRRAAGRSAADTGRLPSREVSRHGPITSRESFFMGSERPGESGEITHDVVVLGQRARGDLVREPFVVDRQRET